MFVQLIESLAYLKKKAIIFHVRHFNRRCYASTISIERSSCKFTIWRKSFIRCHAQWLGLHAIEYTSNTITLVHRWILDRTWDCEVLTPLM